MNRIALICNSRGVTWLRPPETVMKEKQNKKNEATTVLTTKIIEQSIQQLT